jgi:hypothetical protein
MVPALEGAMSSHVASVHNFQLQVDETSRSPVAFRNAAASESLGPDDGA